LVTADLVVSAYGCRERWVPPGTRSAERVIVALRDWVGEFGQAPLAREWKSPGTGHDAIGFGRAWRWASEYPRWPSATTVAKYFGSWSAGLTAAGLDPHQVPWDRERIVAALRAWTTLHARPPRRSEWQARDPTYARPTTKTVHNHFGSWQVALRAAKRAQA
jgi:hypothetical protein